MGLEWWGLWGLLGAFVYAAPRLVVAIGEAQAVGKSAFRQFAEFVVALACGPIFSAGFGPWAAHWLDKEGHPEMRAIALVIGMVANPLAPALVKVATGEILRRAGTRGDQKE